MTEVTPPVPRAIERGLMRLRSIPSCEVEGEPTLDIAAKRWIVSLWLNVEQSSSFVDARTRWYLLIDEAYPYGRIGFYPAMKGGLAATFPHQAYNIASGGQQGWREGKLCLDSPFRGERRTTIIRDPMGDADERLRWHVARALDWVRSAVLGELLADGDPFEIPSHPHTELENWAKVTIVHDESAQGALAWTDREGETGVAELGAIPSIDNSLAISAFADESGVTIRNWGGRPLIRPANMICANWWLWPRPIVVPPWQAPSSWGELRKAGVSLSVNVDGILKRLSQTTRGRQAPTILFLGYPIPMRVGSAPTEIHWDAILMPRLPAAQGKPPRGYRPNSHGWWHRDRLESFGDKEPLVYLRTENWHSDRLQARGRLPPSFREARVAVIGVGALGSTLSELMVRAGLSSIALVDDDAVASGNICRHVATLQDVGDWKVSVVAQRLQQISPIVRVSEFRMAVPSTTDTMVGLLEPFDIIVECTGSDMTLQLLARGWWSIPRLFASFSLGFGARRLFSFGVLAHTFPVDHFLNCVNPWLQMDTAEWARRGEALEGPGCWSPLFPARYDDVMMIASACVKELETMTARHPSEPRFRVFERCETDEGFESFSAIGKTQV